jgi:predicted enzyme involved in methoxymalonyl-ACP biosynthesis
MRSFKTDKDQWFEKKRISEFVKRTNEFKATSTNKKTNERIETIGFHYSSNPFGFHNSESDWFESNNRGRYPILLTLRQVCRA